MRLFLDPKKKWCYVAINKNASITYGQFLQSHGWIEISTNTANGLQCKLFGHIQNPMARYYKGVAEILHKQPDAQSQMKNGLFPTIFLDNHTLPISILTNAIVNEIYFIPMDHPKQSCNRLTNKFFNENGINLNIHTSDNLHISPKRKVEYQTKICEQLRANDHLRLLYKEDNALWKEALKNVDGDVIKVPDTLMDRWRRFLARNLIDLSGE